MEGKVDSLSDQLKTENVMREIVERLGQLNLRIDLQSSSSQTRLKSNQEGQEKVVSQKLTKQMILKKNIRK